MCASFSSSLSPNGEGGGAVPEDARSAEGMVCMALPRRPLLLMDVVLWMQKRTRRDLMCRLDRLSMGHRGVHALQRPLLRPCCSPVVRWWIDASSQCCEEHAIAGQEDCVVSSIEKAGMHYGSAAPMHMHSSKFLASPAHSLLAGTCPHARLRKKHTELAAQGRPACKQPQAYTGR